MQDKSDLLGVPLFQPQEQPWVSAQWDLPAILGRQLTADLLAKAFAVDFKWQHDRYVDEWNDIKTHDGNKRTYTEAGVLMPLLQKEDDIYLLLTQRSAHLKKHSGQISFPGGMVEKTDSSALNAAVRETFEEIGVQPNNISVFGQMPEFLTGSGFVMRPYIAWLNPKISFHINEAEVAKLIQVPMSFLMNPLNHRYYESSITNKLIRCYYGIQWHEFFIWGATAAVIRNLYQRLRQAI